jgi:hypothetical protein
VPYRLLVTALLAITLAACSEPAATPALSTTTQPPTTTNPPTTTTTTTSVPPVWTVGATPLPTGPGGFGKVLPTPPELRNRSLPTKDLLPQPADGAYHATNTAVPDDVLARSTWLAGCPVKPTDLRYLTMSFWGFDGKPHTGEMVVNVTVADNVTAVFGNLFAAKFPLEEMRITSRPELDAPPTGDGNNTGAFVCRPVVGQKNWSAHAYGLAIDLNPFCNPYIKGSLVLPELASSYVDRQNIRPGMVFRGDTAVKAFAAIGWSWGGNWTSPVDLQHFTATGH